MLASKVRIKIYGAKSLRCVPMMNAESTVGKDVAINSSNEVAYLTATVI